MWVETRSMLRIGGARKWFKDPVFLEWINAPGTATWHTKGEEAGEYSDVFFHLCGNDGSDAPGYEKPAPPQEIWDEVVRLATEQFGDGAECLVWVSNEDDDDEENHIEILTRESGLPGE